MDNLFGGISHINTNFSILSEGDHMIGLGSRTVLFATFILVFLTVGFAFSAGTDSLTVTENGNVGIGTDSPGSTLHVYGGSSADTWVGVGPGAAGYGGDGINIGYGGGTYGTGQSFINAHATTASNAKLHLGAGGVAMTLLNNGRVGIGTMTPSYPLHMSNGTMSLQLGFGYGTSNTSFVGSNGTLWLTAGNGSVTAIGNGEGGYGNIYYYAAYPQSDARTKTDIKPLGSSEGLQAVSLLKPVSFHWKDKANDSGVQVGFLAQDVQQVFPGLVSRGEAITPDAPDGVLALNYSGLIAPAVKAVQELKALNDSQTEEIKLLKAANDRLNARLEALEKRMK